MLCNPVPLVRPARSPEQTRQAFVLCPPVLERCRHPHETHRLASLLPQPRPQQPTAAFASRRFFGPLPRKRGPSKHEEVIPCLARHLLWGGMEAQGMQEMGKEVMQTRREGGERGQADRQSPVQPKPKLKVQQGSCVGRRNGELRGCTHRKSSGCQKRTGCQCIKWFGKPTWR